MSVDRDATTACALRAFRWIADRRDRFRGGPDPLVAVKRLAELASTAGAFVELDGGGRDLLGFAWDAVGRGRTIAEALAVEPTLAIAYLPFRWRGLRSDELERRLAEAGWRAGHATWSPVVRAGVGHVLTSIGVPPPWPRQSLLRAFCAVPPARLGHHVALAAHLVMWRTDLGVNWAALTGEELALLHDAIPRWCASLAAAGLVDPLAEVVIANACVRGPDSGAAWEAIIDAQRADGSLPPRAGRDIHGFDETYHPTLVAALAGAMVLTSPARVQLGVGGAEVFDMYRD